MKHPSYSPEPLGPDPKKQEHDTHDQTIIDSLERYFQQTAQIRESSLPRWIVY